MTLNSVKVWEPMSDNRINAAYRWVVEESQQISILWWPKHSQFSVDRLVQMVKKEKETP